MRPQKSKSVAFRRKKGTRSKQTEIVKHSGTKSKQYRGERVKNK
jgi:hypothetical protein